MVALMILFSEPLSSSDLLDRKVTKVTQLQDRITELDDSFSVFSPIAATFDLSEYSRKNSFAHVM